MTNLQAAVGVAQAERLDEILSKKRWIGQRYSELLSENPEIQLPLAKTSFAQNLYWVYAIVLREIVPFDAAEIMFRLRNRGVGCRPFFWPIHQQPVFRNMGFFTRDVLPVSERVSRRGFYIPSGYNRATDRCCCEINQGNSTINWRAGRPILNVSERNT